jgi:hypothetical protein
MVTQPMRYNHTQVRHSAMVKLDRTADAGHQHSRHAFKYHNPARVASARGIALRRGA